MHAVTNERMTKGLPMLDENVKEWVNKNKQPVGLGHLMTLAILEKEKNDIEAQEKAEKEAEADEEMIALRAKERSDELHKLCKEFKVDYGDGKMSDKLLFR